MDGFKKNLGFFFVNVISSLIILELLSVAANEDRKVYIVYMGSVREENTLTSNYHLDVLQQVLESSNAEEFLIRSYKRSFNGFAAKLTQKESENLKRIKDVVSVFPSRTLELQTTRSWDFMGFTESAHTDFSVESNMIIGVIDSGIWPESPSFNDDGFGPPPKKWKGVCNGGKNFTCNNKLIGARSYVGDARDEVGHGSHTASTAAGRKVDEASFYGIAQGSARGGVPSARIVAYKACDGIGCQESDIMAAFDDAIADGVDIITISIGGAPRDIKYDSIAISAFHAADKGILTVQSAGNSGNYSHTVGSIAPWIFTVAASSIDRRIIDKVVLGNGKTLIGNSVNSFSLRGDKFPLVYGQDCAYVCDETRTRLYVRGCLNPKEVKGKIVVCNEMKGLSVAFEVGALGVLGHTIHDGDVSFVVPLPAIALRSSEYETLRSYLNSTKSPVAKILKSEVINDASAPVVVSFSSRGPSLFTTDILKPDISAPGVEILAAFSPIGNPSSFDGDKRSVKYNVLSGTSMACPHVAGASAYVKSLHPDWSPSAIKSALMTTAQPMSPTKNTDAEFAYGSGHLNPFAATKPGLIYETTKVDYIKFLCKLGYIDNDVRQVSGDKTSSCSRKSRNDSSPKDVNYPSISAQVDNGGKPFTLEFHRTVTNVGIANSTYVAKIETRSKTNIIVEPSSLSFKTLKEQKSFTVTISGEGLVEASMISASLVWSDGIHNVRSPIVVYRNITDH